MQFKYYNILWVFLALAVLIFVFMPKKENAFNHDTETQKQIPRSEKNGVISSYTANGILKTKVTYSNGVKNGLSYLFYKDGKTVQLEMPYVNGKREGTSKKYYENGDLYAETQYKNDQLNGIRRLYYSTSRLKAEIPYHKNNPGIGLKEYFMSEKLKEENSIVIKRENNIIYLETALKCKNAKFYIGKLIDDQFFDPIDKNIQLLPNSGSQFLVDLNTFSPSYLKYQDIICSCKTTQGNPQILKLRIDVSSLKNVNQ